MILASRRKSNLLFAKVSIGDFPRCKCVVYITCGETQDVFECSRRNSTLRRKLVLDSLEVITTDSFQNLLGVLINVALYLGPTAGIF